MTGRIIKFRVWNKKTGDWVDGCGPNENNSLDGVNLFGETILLGGFMQDVSCEDLIDCIPLQYTGFEDKNGKNIFEGDIIKYGEDISDVSWCNGGWIITQDEEYCNLSEFAEVSEVVGQFYELDQLIKAGNAKEFFSSPFWRKSQDTFCVDGDEEAELNFMKLGLSLIDGEKGLTREQAINVAPHMVKIALRHRELAKEAGLLKDE